MQLEEIADAVDHGAARHLREETFRLVAEPAENTAEKIDVELALAECVLEIVNRNWLYTPPTEAPNDGAKRGAAGVIPASYTAR